MCLWRYIKPRWDYWKQTGPCATRKPPQFFCVTSKAAGNAYRRLKNAETVRIFCFAAGDPDNLGRRRRRNPVRDCVAAITTAPDFNEQSMPELSALVEKILPGAAIRRSRILEEKEMWISKFDHLKTE
jgi:hypothetical protein